MRSRNPLSTVERSAPRQHQPVVWHQSFVLSLSTKRLDILSLQPSDRRDRVLDGVERPAHREHDLSDKGEFQRNLVTQRKMGSSNSKEKELEEDLERAFEKSALPELYIFV